MRGLSKKIRRSGELMQRVDKIAGDLNVVLIVLAVGLLRVANRRFGAFYCLRQLAP